MIDQNRRRPFTISENYSANKVIISFMPEVTAIAFFHNCLEIQRLCETGKLKDHNVEIIEFDLRIVEWFDTLALCYLLLFAWSARNLSNKTIIFSRPTNLRFLSFLFDNGFGTKIKDLSDEHDFGEEIQQVSYSVIHRCFFPLCIITTQEEITDFVENIRTQMVSAFSDIIDPTELDYAINKVAYFLQETLDNVYSHAYRESNKPCAILIKHVCSKDELDVKTYEKQYVSKTPYINVSVFENYEEYLEVYVADTGVGIRESFLEDPAGAEVDISDENIIEYILTDGQRSHKRMGRVPDTVFGGLYDIFRQFQDDGDSLGIKSDESWYFNGKRTERINTSVLYKNYSQLMHGFALVAAIHFKSRITERYKFTNELIDIVNNNKQKLFSDGNNSILRESLLTTIINDYRPKLDDVISYRADASKANITVRYPDVFWQKGRITEKILNCGTDILIVAGIQESELKKYRSLVESYIANRGLARKVILVTNTLYVFVYNRMETTFRFSDSDTLNYIVTDSKNIGDSFLSFLIWDRAYNSACIWSLAKKMDAFVYLNDSIRWSKGGILQGYLDFSQLCRIPICRNFCINRLIGLHFFEREIYFKSIDRLTEEICEQANYQIHSSTVRKSIYIGSVYVSGSSTRMSEALEDNFYFFKHSNSNDKQIYSIFEWATRIDWINNSFLNISNDQNHYARIGYTPFVASGGASYWSKRHYTDHRNEYRLTQSEIYQVLQRQIGIHPKTMYVGHIDCSDHHDLFGFRTTALYESDLNLNQIIPKYNEKSCFDFLITEFIYALCGTCSISLLEKEVLSSKLSAGKRKAIVKKFSAAKKAKKKTKCGIIVYLYDFQTANIMEKAASFFSERYQRRIIPIMSVTKDYSETSLSVPPLLLDRIQGVVESISDESRDVNGTSTINATVFMATSFSIRIQQELKHVLMNIGASKVTFLTLLDRQRILLKSSDSSAISFGRIDLPSLGSKSACPLCNSAELLRDVKNELITPDLIDRIDAILLKWALTKESDNAFNKGIIARPIHLSPSTEEAIRGVSKEYDQGEFVIQTDVALAMFAVENAIITSCPDFLTYCVDSEELLFDEAGNVDHEMSDKVKILLLCAYLLSAATAQTPDRQIAEYAKKLCEIVERQKDVSEYSALAVIAICSLPSVFQKHLQVLFIEEDWNDVSKCLNFDSLLIHLVLYHTICHRLNSSVNTDYANLLRCYFKSGKSQLDFIYETFLYSEKDYKQSHVQALAQIASSSQLEKHIYQKGAHYIAKIIELVSSKYYETLFHDPMQFVSNREKLRQNLVYVKDRLDDIVESSPMEKKVEARGLVSGVLERLHTINTRGIYLRVPSCEDERMQIEKWLKYCQEKAFERVPPKYRYEEIILSIETNGNWLGVSNQSHSIRPWFYSFSDVTEEVINVYVDMLKGASQKMYDNSITKSNSTGEECVGIVKVRFFGAHVEITFYNATANDKTIEEIREIKDSKRSRSSLIVFREFKRKLKHIEGPEERKQCFTWEYVEDRFPGCVKQGVHIFSATIRIPYIDMGSSSAFEDK